MTELEEILSKASVPSMMAGGMSDAIEAGIELQEER